MIEAEHGSRIAILIGTNEYSKMEKLEFAENDAREMAETLLDPDICGFDEVIELIDQNKEEVSQSIEKVFKNAKQDDEVLIYYSGHGKPSYKFDLCLLFKDTDPESLLATSLKFDYIHECKEQSACKRLVIILDCCYSGTAGMRGNYLEEMLSSYSGSGTVLLTSTGETGSNIAKEDRELKHGVFTHYLLKGLKDWAADDDDDGIITVDDLYKYTFNETKAKGLQWPQKKGSYQGEMVLGRNIQKIKYKELEEKNEKLIKCLNSAPPWVLNRSLTILQKIYENPSAMDPAEASIKPYLESLLDGKFQVENYIITVTTIDEQLKKQKGKTREREGKKPEKDQNDHKPLPPQKKSPEDSGKKILIMIIILETLLISILAVHEFFPSLEAPVASFSVNPTKDEQGEPLLLFDYTGKGGAPTSCYWDFGDGDNSIEQSPKHKFIKSGEYNVTLTVINKAGKSTVNTTVYGPPVANFHADITSGETPLKVNFTSNSTGNPTQYFWIFETQEGKDWHSFHPVNAKHTFKEPGVYTITLVVINDAGHNFSTKPNYITVYSNETDNDNKIIF